MSLLGRFAFFTLGMVIVCAACAAILPGGAL